MPRLAGDRPAEGISAFGHEALLSASLLQRCSSKTLALVDEFGRGTEPRAAVAAVAALVAELGAAGTSFVVATHLHEVVDLVGSEVDYWRMGMRKEGWLGRSRERDLRVDSSEWRSLNVR